MMMIYIRLTQKEKRKIMIYIRLTNAHTGQCIETLKP